MANEYPILVPPGLTAAGDLSSHQHKIVKMTSTGVALADGTAGEAVLGVQQDNGATASGDPVSVMTAGVTKVISAEALATGDFVGPNASGLAKKVDPTNTGADIGEVMIGMVIGASSGVNELATVLLGVFPIVEAA